MKLVRILLGLIALTCFTAGLTTGSLVSEPERVDNETSIVFVFDQDFEPFTYVENGSIYGFELDLLRLVGQEEGFRLIPRPMNWREAQLSFQKGDADVIGGLVKTKERLKQYNFTARPHGTFDILTFVRDDSDIRSAGMLKGRKVAVQNASTSLDILKNQTNVQLMVYGSESEGLQALLQGKADAFVGGGSTTWFRIKQQNISGVRSLATPWEMHSLHFGVRDPKLLQSLDRGLERLMQDGRYDQLYRRWFVQELDESEILALVSASRQASFNSYAPYSRYSVGAAVLTTSGRIYSGCNIENALYSLSTSALKVAVFKAISEGDNHIRATVTSLPDGGVDAPTGDERQILFELDRGILAVLGDEGNYTTKMVSEIFPYPFELRD